MFSCIFGYFCPDTFHSKFLAHHESCPTVANLLKMVIALNGASIEQVTFKYVTYFLSCEWVFIQNWVTNHLLSKEFKLKKEPGQTKLINGWMFYNF